MIAHTPCGVNSVRNQIKSNLICWPATKTTCTGCWLRTSCHCYMRAKSLPRQTDKSVRCRCRGRRVRRFRHSALQLPSLQRDATQLIRANEPEHTVQSTQSKAHNPEHIVQSIQLKKRYTPANASTQSSAYKDEHDMGNCPRGGGLSTTTCRRRCYFVKLLDVLQRNQKAFDAYSKVLRTFTLFYPSLTKMIG